jgi:hypothetical protein
MVSLATSWVPKHCNGRWSGQEGNLPHAWITPLGLMQEEHWQTLAVVWRGAAGCAPVLTPPRRAPDR